MEMKQQEEEKIRQVCTFKPQIAPSKYYYSSMGNSYSNGGFTPEQLYERNLAWQHQR